eukprot:Clim_evm50s149 gene=Clim_evmTU50s149
MKPLSYCILLVLVVFASGLDLTIEHDLTGTGKFTQRAKVIFSHVDEKTQGLVTGQDGGLSASDISALKTLAKEGKPYRIRTKSSPTGSASYVMTYINANDLVEAGLRDRLLVTVDGQSQAVLALDYGVRRKSFLTTETQSQTDAKAFNTMARLDLQTEVPNVFLEAHLATRKNVRPDGSKEEEQSFIQKNWHYLLIGLLLVQVLGAMAPQQG